MDIQRFSKENSEFWIPTRSLPALKIPVVIQKSLGQESLQGKNSTTNELAIFSNSLRLMLDEGPGVVVVRGFPLSEDWSTLESRFLFFSSKLGDIVEQQSDGAVIKRVTNRGCDLQTTTTRGHETNDALPFHSDRPDFTSLLCVQSASKGGESSVISSMWLHEEIRQQKPELLQILYEPFPQYSRGSAVGVNHVPIFSFVNGRLVCRYIRRFINDAIRECGCKINHLQHAALDFMDFVLANVEPSTRFPLRPGDVLLVNNFTTLHARTAFEDLGEPRVMLRVWLSSPTGRQLPTSFESLYTSIKMGDLRAPRWN